MDALPCGRSAFFSTWTRDGNDTHGARWWVRSGGSAKACHKVATFLAKPNANIAPQAEGMGLLVGSLRPWFS